MTSPEPFYLNVSDDVLGNIRRRVADYPWHEMPDDGTWMHGTNLDYMREICAYWVDHYNWRQHEARINRFDQFNAPIDGLDIHYIHENGSGPAPMPLVISHGWPRTVVEFLDFIEPLAHPERFGGHVVMPSRSWRLLCLDLGFRADRTGLTDQGGWRNCLPR